MGRFSKGGVGLYTRTADEDFIIDHHPEYPHVSIRIFRALLQVQQCGGGDIKRDEHGWEHEA
ncbi:hypothetical protein ACH95_07005 [Bacillus glycinifermentans]|uniref:Uncharacterized protein n=1 Tax=Bacillus glycinifermentans TaxID=1664069 RepID=A0A0J6EVH7_9BACI|nr:MULTISPECIES: hypothetical protein [Bacillus]ATH94410.1 hypothetical protein COP00_18850 [Bacillus glycinifermentans]KMM61568.1 hypothetical protein ACH95_07005 [Bacillus glycinifermentans]KRT95836.1 hypothetical protein AB447_201725 [Bacillus glycinifermentans]TWM22442.1 hypothetical protein CHCC14821_2837 [Bacillus paralicheniformis]